MEMIPIDDLNIDPAYQRAIIPEIVNAIARNFCDEVFGTLNVGRRKDTSLWVADGQQRLMAAQRIGREAVPCDTFASRGREHEAEVFRKCNKFRRAVSSNNLFRAALVAGDTQSVEILAAVERCGFELVLNGGSTTKAHQIRQANPLEKLFASGGIALLERVLRAIKKAWSHEEKSTSAYLFAGIGRFFRTYPEADDSRVAKCLTGLSPSQILRYADDAKQLIGGGREAVVAKSIFVRYNQRLSDSRRLTEKPAP